MSRSPEDAETNSRTPRRRATSTRQRATRQRMARGRAERVEPEKTTAAASAPKPAAKPASDNRKAPTSIAAKKTSERQKRKQAFVVLGLFVAGIAASAAVGVIDAGQINVQETIEARNERIRNNQPSGDDTAASKIEVPVQSTKAQKPDGGLRGFTPEEEAAQAPKPKPVVSTSTATSSDATASSTAATASSTESVQEDMATTSDSSS